MQHNVYTQVVSTQGAWAEATPVFTHAACSIITDVHLHKNNRFSEVDYSSG